MAGLNKARAHPNLRVGILAGSAHRALVASLALLSCAAFAQPAPAESPIAPSGASEARQPGYDSSRGPESGWVNVLGAPYLARGDGKTDDTAPIQAALDAVGAKGGGVVYLPTGRYLVKTHLSVPAETALVGVGRAPEVYAEKMPGSTLLAVEGAGQADGTAFITLQGPDSTLQGLKVLYPNQVIADAPVAYPWTVRGGAGDGAALIDVLLVNPYQAVDLATLGGSRHYIRGLYGQPLFKGIWVDKCYDIGRIHDVHFWPFWSMDKRVMDFTESNATSFIFQRADWEVVENIFSWGYHVGVEFSASKDGAMNGQMTDVDFDGVDIGIDARATQQPGVSISNLAIANDTRGKTRIAVWGRSAHDGATQIRSLNGHDSIEPASAVIFIRGGSFWGALNRIIKWENTGFVSLSDSRLVPWSLNGPMIEIMDGQASVHDNSFLIYPDVVKGAVPGTGVLVGPKARDASIHDNQMNGNRIENAAGDRATIANNRP
jgi:hypothetical protein